MRAKDHLIQAISNTPKPYYDEIAAHLRLAQDAFREYVCQELQEALNVKLAEMPHDVYEDKQRLAVWLNSELLHFGIAAQCPKTGLPCSVHADPGSNAAVGRFRLRPIEDDLSRTFSSMNLFALSLTPRPNRKTRFDRWADRMSR